MPSKVRDSSAERRREKKESSRTDKDKRERDRDRPKDRDRDRDKDKDKHRSSRKVSTREKTSSRTSISPVDEKRRSSMPGKIEDASESKSSLPYPTLSKEHARESVGLSNRPVLNLFTPPATDLNASKDRLSSSKPPTPANNAPPSPPLTDKNSGTGKWKSNAGKPVTVETIPEDKSSHINGFVKSTSKARIVPKVRMADGHQRSSSDVGSNTSPSRKSRDIPSSNLKPATPVSMRTPHRAVRQPTRIDSPATTAGATSATDSGTNISSEATSIAPEQPTIQRPGSKIPPAAYVDSPAVVLAQSRGATPLDVFVADDISIMTGTPGGVSQTPGPPPPPPPPVPVSIPKVDYLLQHGGLTQSVPRNLLHAGKPMAIQQAQSPNQPPIVVANLFEPYIGLLDNFEKVISKNGSLAVATGYRSVARRLLDRLEAVFARDISSEACKCPLCDYDGVDDVRGVSWGEVLELVSGRKDLPAWPPFTFTQSPVGLGISLEMHVPMQKLDIDVPEEYREHYIRQSRKTKQSVDKWLNRQGENPTSPPEEVDDETLTFAILTHLPAEQRPTFKDLMGIVDRPIEPPKRIPTPELEKQNGAARAPVPTPTPAPPKVRQQHLILASQAIQRLYRLHFQPRDSEAALFLLNNPSLHNALATLAAISSDEWDILISGRFDGFLRSGAEDVVIPEHLPPSRGHTPHRPATRGATPGYGPQVNGTGYRSRQGSQSNSYNPPHAQYGAPIAFDEETELATLAEIERDIYAGMEALEDAFEALHNKAEVVRRVMRERSAGLAAAAQRRRGGMGGGDIEVRMNTPASGVMGSSAENGIGRWDTETDDGLGEWEALSEIAPDDSASNISSSRRRRPKRRNERRTPALIEEEDEFDDGVSDGTASPRKR